MIDPNKVTAPKDKWELIGVLYDGGAGEESIAYGKWEGTRVICCRYNGSAKSGDAGFPKSKSNSAPMWFVLPWWIGEAALKRLLWDYHSGDPDWSKGINHEALCRAVKECRLEE